METTNRCLAPPDSLVKAIAMGMLIILLLIHLGACLRMTPMTNWMIITTTMLQKPFRDCLNPVVYIMCIDIFKLVTPVMTLFHSTGNFLVYCSRAQKNYYRNAFSKTELGLKLDDVAITYNNRLNRGTKLKQSDKIRDVCFFALTGYKTSIGNQKRFLNYPWQGLGFNIVS